MNVIDCKEISLSFGRRQILKSLNFELKPSEAVHIRGENGVGKTSFLKILATLLKPTSGQVNWAIDRKKLGVVFPESYFYPELTVLENLNLYAKLYGIRRRSDEIASLMKNFHLDSLKDARVSTLSRGERQKASLIRSIQHDPEVILWDEPFTALDETSRNSVIHWIEQARKKKTWVLITHEEDPKWSWIDRHLTLSSGVLQ